MLRVISELYWFYFNFNYKNVIESYLRRQKFGKSYVDNIISTLSFLCYIYFGNFHVFKERIKYYKKYYIWMASLLLLKHSSFFHCSLTIKQPFTITILKIYLKYRQFLYHYLHYFFYREILSLPDLLLKDFFKSGFNC